MNSEHLNNEKRAFAKGSSAIGYEGPEVDLSANKKCCTILPNQKLLSSAHLLCPCKDFVFFGYIMTRGLLLSKDLIYGMNGISRTKNLRHK